MKRYKDIFLDFDDTLYDTYGNACLALEELYGQFGLYRHFDSLEDFTVPYWQVNRELWQQYAAGEITRDYLILERFRRPLSLGRGLEDVGSEYCLAVSDSFIELCAVKPGLVDGARETVDYLRSRGYALHMCSNGFREVQYRKLRACGLADCFDTVVLSEDAGVNKPSPDYFKYAIRVTGALPDTTLMVGDNYHTDILGAMGVGMDTMWFNRHPDEDIADVRPLYEILSLDEIRGIL